MQYVIKTHESCFHDKITITTNLQPVNIKILYHRVQYIYMYWGLLSNSTQERS